MLSYQLIGQNTDRCSKRDDGEVESTSERLCVLQEGYVIII